MICVTCARAADEAARAEARIAAIPTPDQALVERLTRSAGIIVAGLHNLCPGGTWCCCQHRKAH